MSKKTIIEIIEGEMPTGAVDETKAIDSEAAFPVSEGKVEAYQHHGGHESDRHGGSGGSDHHRWPPWPTTLVRCPNCGGVLRVIPRPSVVRCCFCNNFFNI